MHNCERKNNQKIETETKKPSDLLSELSLSDTDKKYFEWIANHGQTQQMVDIW